MTGQTGVPSPWRYFSPCRQGRIKQDQSVVTVLAQRSVRYDLRVSSEVWEEYLVVRRDGDADPTTMSHHLLDLLP